MVTWVIACVGVCLFLTAVKVFVAHLRTLDAAWCSARKAKEETPFGLLLRHIITALENEKWDYKGTVVLGDFVQWLSYMNIRLRLHPGDKLWVFITTDKGEEPINGLLYPSGLMHLWYKLHATATPRFKSMAASEYQITADRCWNVVKPKVDASRVQLGEDGVSARFIQNTISNAQASNADYILTTPAVQETPNPEATAPAEPDKPITFEDARKHCGTAIPFWREGNDWYYVAGESVYQIYRLPSGSVAGGRCGKIPPVSDNKITVQEAFKYVCALYAKLTSLWLENGMWRIGTEVGVPAYYIHKNQKVGHLYSSNLSLPPTPVVQETPAEPEKPITFHEARKHVGVDRGTACWPFWREGKSWYYTSPDGSVYEIRRTTNGTLGHKQTSLPPVSFDGLIALDEAFRYVNGGELWLESGKWHHRPPNVNGEGFVIFKNESGNPSSSATKQSPQPITFQEAGKYVGTALPFWREGEDWYYTYNDNVHKICRTADYLSGQRQDRVPPVSSNGITAANAHIFTSGLELWLENNTWHYRGYGQVAPNGDFQIVKGSQGRLSSESYQTTPAPITYEEARKFAGDTPIWKKGDDWFYVYTLRIWRIIRTSGGTLNAHSDGITEPPAPGGVTAEVAYKYVKEKSQRHDLILADDGWHFYLTGNPNVKSGVERRIFTDADGNGTISLKWDTPNT